MTSMLRVASSCSVWPVAGPTIRKAQSQRAIEAGRGVGQSGRDIDDGSAGFPAHPANGIEAKSGQAHEGRLALIEGADFERANESFNHGFDRGSRQVRPDESPAAGNLNP